MHLAQKNRHVGVYGVMEREGAILVVRKSRGPYRGLFDLPGGQPLHGEPLLEALTREIKEETGIEASDYSLVENLSFLTSYTDVDTLEKELYHIALIYRVRDFQVKSFNPNIIEEDVHGSLWIDRNSMCKKDCSPLLQSILELQVQET